MNIETTRPNEFHQVCTWLDTPANEGTVDIYGLSGYGGVGKTFLLRQALEHKQPLKHGFLTITVDGSNPSILGNLMGIYDHNLAPKAIPLGKRNFDYFPRSRRLVREHARLARAVNEAVKSSATAEELKEAASLIFRGGSILNSTIPKSREYLDFEAMKRQGYAKQIDEAVDLLFRLKPLEISSWIPGPIKDALGITYGERLRSDLYRLAADEWVGDLSAMLNQYRSKDRWRITHSPIEGLHRLLLVIDDFEIIGKTIIDFVRTALVPALEQSNFHTTIVFLGRDDLSDAHVSFQHHLSHLVRGKVRLDRFSDDVAKRMFVEAGYHESEFGKLLEESFGYPFLVNLLCEAKGGSVSFYQQFFERTTRWMGPTERDWVLPLCYLERITHESVPKMLPNPPPSAVIEWFKHEASLRDPNAEWYIVAPYIRRALIEHHRKQIGTKQSDELVSKGKAASIEA